MKRIINPFYVFLFGLLVAGTAQAENVTVKGVAYFPSDGGFKTLEECNKERKELKSGTIAEAERAYQLDYVDKKTNCLAQRKKWTCGEPYSYWDPVEPTSCVRSTERCGEIGAPCFVLDPRATLYVYQKLCPCNCDDGSDPAPSEE